MAVETAKIELNTKGGSDIIDITPMVSEKLKKSKIDSGIACIFITGSTAAVTIIEYESGLLKDFPRAMDRIAPKGGTYEHNRGQGDGNGSSHVKSSIIGQCITVPFSGKKLMLGTWQQIVAVDFDTQQRKREIIVQIIGN